MAFESRKIKAIVRKHVELPTDWQRETSWLTFRFSRFYGVQTPDSENHSWKTRCQGDLLELCIQAGIELNVTCSLTIQIPVRQDIEWGRLRTRHRMEVTPFDQPSHKKDSIWEPIYQNLEQFSLPEFHSIDNWYPNKISQYGEHLRPDSKWGIAECLNGDSENNAIRRLAPLVTEFPAGTGTYHFRDRCDEDYCAYWQRERRRGCPSDFDGLAQFTSYQNDFPINELIMSNIDHEYNR
jgi:hypothetical protein